jgi:hypothetical protein
MTETLPIEVTALAARHIREAEKWWRVNRTAAPNAIRQELQRVFSLIASHQHVGGRATNVRLPNVRRIYLPRIKYHLYFHVVEVPTRIQVVALWHARRGDGPPI